MFSFYAGYLKWLRHLVERLGSQNTLSIWKNSFADYDDQLLMSILLSGWQKLGSDRTNQLEAKTEELIKEFFSPSTSSFSRIEVSNIIENTPPIAEIKRLFSTYTIEKEITAYNALHLRIDGFACLAESLIDKYGKQGEFIVYDLIQDGRLASSQGDTGSVKNFIENFTSKLDTLRWQQFSGHKPSSRLP
jgi:hypothetical protein